MTTTKATVRGLAARLSGAKAALQELHELDRELRERHAEAVARRQRLRNAPPPKAELVANLNTLVDKAVKDQTEYHSYDIVRSLAGGLEATRYGEVRRPPKLPELLTTYRELRGADVVLLFPELIKRRLAEIIEATDYQAGPPTADRDRLIAEADAEIRRIEDEHEDLVNTAASLEPPVQLALLPAVQQRRDAEASRRQREAEALARQRAAEEAAERAHAERVRAGGRSPYLDALAAERAALRRDVRG